MIIKQRKQKRQGDPRKLMQGNRILGIRGIQGVQQREQQDSDSSASFQIISNNNEQYQIQNNSNSGG